MAIAKVFEKLSAKMAIFLKKHCFDDFLQHKCCNF
jgi:hypothetical protein